MNAPLSLLVSRTYSVAKVSAFSFSYIYTTYLHATYFAYDKSD